MKEKEKKDLKWFLMGLFISLFFIFGYTIFGRSVDQLFFIFSPKTFGSIFIRMLIFSIALGIVATITSVLWDLESQLKFLTLIYALIMTLFFLKGLVGLSFSIAFLISILLHNITTVKTLKEDKKSLRKSINFHTKSILNNTLKLFVIAFFIISVINGASYSNKVIDGIFSASYGLFSDYLTKISMNLYGSSMMDSLIESQTGAPNEEIKKEAMKKLNDLQDETFEFAKNYIKNLSFIKPIIIILTAAVISSILWIFIFISQIIAWLFSFIISSSYQKEIEKNQANQNTEKSNNQNNQNPVQNSLIQRSQINSHDQIQQSTPNQTMQNQIQNNSITPQQNNIAEIEQKISEKLKKELNQQQ